MKIIITIKVEMIDVSYERFVEVLNDIKNYVRWKITKLLDYKDILEKNIDVRVEL